MTPAPFSLEAQALFRELVDAVRTVKPKHPLGFIEGYLICYATKGVVECAATIELIKGNGVPLQIVLESRRAA